jgi:transcription elongation factor Elf1
VRNKILEKFADHILKESCPHCQHIVRQALIVEDDDRKTHCKKCGEWLENAASVVRKINGYSNNCLFTIGGSALLLYTRILASVQKDLNL